jgi:hypothetical protein
LLLFEFSEGQLPQEQRETVDEHLKSCEACSELLQDIWEMEMKSSSWKELDVPAWDRKGSFVATPKTFHWLQYAGALSSILILVLVLFRVELTTNDQGLHLSFGGQDKDAYSHELEAKLKDFELRNQTYMLAAFSEMTAQQATSNQQLFGTVLESSRRERRKDLQTLMTVWNDDQQRQQQITEDSLRFVLLNQARESRNIDNLSSILDDMRTKQDVTL